MCSGDPTMAFRLLFLYCGIAYLCVCTGFQWSKPVLRQQRILQKIISFSAGAFAAVITSTSPSYAAVDLPKVFDDGSIYFHHTEDLVFSPKPVKTHEKEVYLKSESSRGFNAGVTVDKVKINSIEEFATPAALAKKVVDVEKSKDGVFEADIISYGESKSPVSASARPSYDIEYKIASSHGNNHYVIKATVVNGKLYVFTVATKEDNFPQLSETARAIVDSFKLTQE